MGWNIYSALPHNEFNNKTDVMFTVRNTELS